MSEENLSDSRFHMWRAVFAMAHVDGEVTDDEVTFVENYLERVPFSDAHKEALRQDLSVPQKVSEMLAHVSDPADQSDFFQFSQMLVLADDDYSASEKAILERMRGAQADAVGTEDMLRKIRGARKAAMLRRAIEDQAFEEQAKDVVGIANVVRYITPSVDRKSFETPSEAMFKLWRAVFSLVHVDGDVSEEEESYIQGMMDLFYFSDEQRGVIDGDLKKPADVVELFQGIEGQAHRKQFFMLARTIVWCDGIFHDDEREALEAVEASLDNPEEYAGELRFLMRKPAMPDGVGGDSDEERMMRHVVTQMAEFYTEGN